MKFKDIEQVEDEKGSGGLWDEAGEIAENYELQRVERDDNEPVYTDERLQEMIYNALTTAEQRGTEIERKRISTLIKIKLTDPKDYAYNHLLDLLDNLNKTL